MIAKKFVNGRLLGIAVMVAAALAGLMLLEGVVWADNKMDLHCGDGRVEEGDSKRVRVQIVEHDPWNPEEVWWYTEAGTADESDYPVLDGVKEGFSFEEHDADRLYRNIHTTEDIYPELDETFTLRIGNQDNTSDKTSCTITIVNDDGGGVYKAEFSSTPADGETYGAGEFIEVTMIPTHPARVPNNIVGVVLRVGEGDDNYRLATFTGDPSESHETMVFRYEVQPSDLDTDGVSVDEGGAESGFPDLHGYDSVINVVVGGDYQPISRVYRGIAESPDHKVAGRPYVKAVEVVSTPEDGIAYRAGESIDIDVTFDQDVVFSRDPELLLYFDGFRGGTVTEGEWKTAFYDADASTASRYRFSRTVRPRQEDNNGISVTGFGTTQAHSAADPSVAAVLTFIPEENISGQNVDGGDGRPRITSLTVTSSPRVGDTYGNGERIVITMEVDQDVGVGRTPSLGLLVGREDKSAIYHADASDSDTLVFRYRVYSDHMDDNGITIKANDIDSNNIYAIGDSTLLLVEEYAEQRNLSGHKVDGSLDTRPTIESLRFVSDPGPDGFYRKGDVIRLRLDFTESVTSQSSERSRPTVTMNLDSGSRRANYDGEEDGAIFFTYTVTAEDRDTNGIAIGGDWLFDGYHYDDSGASRALFLASDGVSADTSGDRFIPANASHKVDGGLGVASVGVVSSPVNPTGYRVGETIEVEITFETEVTATGEAGLKLSIGEGDETVTASYAGEADAPASNKLRFSYEVQPGDIDDDGLTIPAIAYDGLGGDAVTAANQSSVNHSFAAQEDLSGQLVDGRARAKTVSVVSSPASDDTYEEDEVIRVKVSYDQELGVEGEVSISLQIGDEVRTAWFDSSGSLITHSPEFTYTVQADDYDGDGIEILNGLGGDGFMFAQANLKDAPVAFVNPTPGSLSGHKVGYLPDVTAPTISSIALSSDPGDGVYAAGETIQVTVTFSEEVTVTGSPRLEIDFDGTPRRAEFESVDGAAAAFAYTVVEGDSDSDGIGIGANKLSLNGGEIEDLAANSAVLTHDAVGEDDGHKVDGGLDVTAPTISSITVTSDPGDDYTYGAGDRITVAVTFTEDVVVTGAPQLELEFYDPGSANRQADFESVDGATVVFALTVEAEDSASDGLSIEPNKLTLNGGTIRDAAGNDAALTHSAFGPDPDHLVSTIGGL